MIRMWSRRLTALLIASSLTLLSGSSSAQPKPTVSPSATPARVDELFDKGTALYKQARWAEAEAQFLAAWDQKKTFDIAANLGDCELENGENSEAAQHLAYALRAFPVSGKASLRERLQDRFALARSRVAALQVKVSVPGATVRIDGRLVGLAPLPDPVFVDPGRHEIVVQLDDYETGQAVAEVTQGSSRDFAFALIKKKTAVSSVTSVGPNQAVLIGGSVTAGLALATGVVFTVLANGKANAANQSRDALATAAGGNACSIASNGAACSVLRGSRQDASTFTNVAGWAFVGAGVVGAGTLLYGWLTPAKMDRYGLTAVPIVSADTRGLILGGSF